MTSDNIALAQLIITDVAILVGPIGGCLGVVYEAG